MVYVVLGMHKSGTTLVSQILHHSGIDMGEGIKTGVLYDKGNQYERTSTQALNQEILDSAGKLSIDIEPPKLLSMTEDQRCRMQEIIQRCSLNSDHWGFKDPRTTLVYPLWAQELPEHRVIAIYRSLDELWLRYRPKAAHRRYRDFQVARKLVQRWCEYNSRIVTYLQETPMKALLLEYGSLMGMQAEFELLQDFVEMPLVDRRNSSLYRNRAQRQPLMLSLATWWVEKKTRQHPAQILSQLDILRNRN